MKYRSHCAVVGNTVLELNTAPYMPEVTNVVPVGTRTPIEAFPGTSPLCMLKIVLKEGVCGSQQHRLQCLFGMVPTTISPIFKGAHGPRKVGNS